MIKTLATLNLQNSLNNIAKKSDKFSDFLTRIGRIFKIEIGVGRTT